MSVTNKTTRKIIRKDRPVKEPSGDHEALRCELQKSNYRVTLSLRKLRQVDYGVKNSPVSAEGYFITSYSLTG